ITISNTTPRFSMFPYPTFFRSAAISRIDGIAVDDVLQRVRESLFVGGKIASYAGRGELAKWIRTIAMRTAMDQLSSRTGAREIADRKSTRLNSSHLGIS